MKLCGITDYEEYYVNNEKVNGGIILVRHKDINKIKNGFNKSLCTVNGLNCNQGKHV